MLPLHTDWIDPLDAAAAIDRQGGDMALLHSGIQGSYSGRYSLLAWEAEETVQADDFAPLAAILTNDKPPFANAWFGWLGYGLKNRVESLPSDPPGRLQVADLHFTRFRHIARFDHLEKRVEVYSAPDCRSRESGNLISIVEKIPAFADRKGGVSQMTEASSIPRILNLTPNMTREEYLAKVEDILARIRQGELYQANLTRKVLGEFTEIPDAFALFRQLCAVSPAQYAAYLKFGDLRVLSSSPERFLKVDADGTVHTRPIKGSAARLPDTTADAQEALALQASEKNRAENLMIVDLMRNDLSRGCVTGSVQVPELFALDSYATIHHLSSDVTGRKRTDCSTLQLVQHCFPPGSMTGAPKIAAMKCISALEPQARGIYSGALGWFGGDGSCDLSVVIRTLILQGKQFEFQTGGGIVADSTPEGEWQEMLAKAKGVCRALGISNLANT